MIGEENQLYQAVRELLKKCTMKKIIVLFALICMYVDASSKADTIKPKSPWGMSGVTSLNFVQSSYSNWAAGGENAIAGTSSGALTLKYKKGNVAWENVLSLAYGLTFQGDKKSKNDDKIDFSSKLGYKAFKNWDYSVMASLRTQFDKGYAAYPIVNPDDYKSKFFAPAYVFLSFGMDYKPNEHYTLLLSPLTSKLTFVTDPRLSDMGSFGVKPGETLFAEYGAYVKTVYTTKLHENIALRSSLDLFSNLLEKPENVDINWELTLNLKVTKLISTKISTQLLYDDNVKTENNTRGARVQFKQVLGVGFAYIF